MTYDVASVRAQFPALAEGLAHFDGPGGTQVPEAVSNAIHEAYRSALSNRHGPFSSSRRADAIVDGARAAAGDLLGCPADQVFFGPSMTANTYLLANALAAQWQPGDEVVVSRLDHDANVRPWVQAAERVGAVVRWADVDPVTTELPADQYEELVGPRTRLVAVTAASNATGTRPEVRRIADLAHAVGALVHVDGVHSTPHVVTDLDELGADLYGCSAYKWYGPHAGLTSGPALREIRPQKLLPSSDAVPERFELGTPGFAVLAGVTAAVDWIASHGTGSGRRERVVSGLAGIAAHEATIFDHLLDGLRSRPDVTIVGSPGRRTPTVSFLVTGRTPQQVSEDLGRAGVAAWAGNYYAVELMRRLGLQDSGGAVRAGVVGYTCAADVDRLLAAL
ncbi:MAG: cysteine desulfurase-like protein [Actinomycetota bacterium]|nr:cysteine desulfurase-like protein [Actinomycetota bacterium]